MSRLFWVPVALLALASAAHAETRLFSVRTSQQGVSVVQAARNGIDLPVAGQNSGATFFRIDNPQGAVPCNNRIRFVTSAGQSLDRVIDMCASNWDVTLNVGGTGTAPTPAPAPTPVPVVKPAPAPKPVAPPAATATVAVSGIQPVAIAIDDPNSTITNVFLRGQEVPIVNRADPYVQINLLGGAQGFACARDLGLALSDGRRIARDVDVCASGFVVVVPLTGGPRPPAPAANIRPRTTFQPLPQAPAPAPQPEPQPMPLPAGPELVTGMQWLFSAAGQNASLAYALPNSDGGEFAAVCQLRSRNIQITLTRSADELGPGATVPVTFTAGAFTRTYTAGGSEISELDGLSHPLINVTVADPLWASLIKERTVAIAVGSTPPYALSLSGSSPQVKQFLAACSPAPPPPPPLPSSGLPPPQGPAGGAIGYACDDGSYISVTFGGNTAAVYDQGSTPVVLFAVPSQQGARWVAGASQLVGLGEQVYWTVGGYTRACARG
jgi:hypothetical protein